MILAIPISIYSGIYITILEDTSLISYNTIIGVFLSYFYTVLVIHIFLHIVNKLKSTSFFILSTIVLSIVSIFFYLNYLTLSSVGYSVKFEHFQLIWETGLSEFIIQSGINKDEVVELFLYLSVIFIISYIFINKILNLFQKKIKKISLLLILLIILVDVVVSWYKISTNINSIFNSTYSQAIIFRPNIAKYFLDEPSFEIENKTKLDTDIKCHISKGSSPHIVIFMAESLRADMTTKEIMPNLNELNGKLFKNNYSTSNGTFFALFSVLYGLFPNYYHDTIEKSKPTILNITENLNYHRSLYSTLSLNFVGMNHFLNDKYFNKHYQRMGKDEMNFAKQDQEIIDDFKTNFNKSGNPEFHLLITNSTHHDYHLPKNKKFEKFKPYQKEPISLLRDNPNLYKELVFNRYKNSIYYIDSLIQQTVETIKEQSQWDNTIFIFFGDHGEEFLEEGHLLHSNWLNYYQSTAALFIHAPSSNKKIEVFKTTSHMDIVPTIISILKKNNVNISQSNWLKGKNILSPIYTDRAVFIQQISKTKDIQVAIANKKNIFIPTKIEKDTDKKKLIEKYIKDLISY